jgi:hypothetical protein
MKEVIVEFIEEGTDRVIRTCSLEEYNNQIESINNTIPKEYKFLKKNVMKKITLLEVVAEMTYQWDLDDCVNTLLFRGSGNYQTDENRNLLRPIVQELYDNYEFMRIIDMVELMVDELGLDIDIEDRTNISREILRGYGGSLIKCDGNDVEKVLLTLN